MPENIAERAIRSVFSAEQAFCKFISANDSCATGGHQSGILISMSAAGMLFSQPPDGGILKRRVEIRWQDDIVTESCFTYYSSKNELRVTRFGRGFPYLRPELTGALFVLTRQDEDAYSAYILERDDDMEQFLNAFNISATETNRLIDSGRALPESLEKLLTDEFIAGLTADFPSSEEMSAAARRIQNRVYGHGEYVRTNPDRKIIDWTDAEYRLFRAVEQARYGAAVARGFASVDEFVTMANMVLNRRKSRAGKSLEHHLAAIFDANGLQYSAQAVTEGNKRPDFLFPSQAAYRDASFPDDGLVSLAAKTTCKDRWRQVINEADRLRDRPKYLCTLQQGVSPAQMDEMEKENVVLVVPKPYIPAFPADRQDRIWTVGRFVNHIRELEGL